MPTPTPPSQALFSNGSDKKPPLQLRSPLFNVIRKPITNFKPRSIPKPPLVEQEMKKIDDHETSQAPENSQTVNTKPDDSQTVDIKPDDQPSSPINLKKNKTKLSSKKGVDGISKISHKKTKQTPAPSRPKNSADGKKSDHLTTATVSIMPQCTVQFKCPDKPFFEPDETEEKKWKPSRERRLSSTERDFIPTNLGKWRLVGYQGKFDIDETKDMLLIEKRKRSYSVPSIFVVGKTKYNNSITHVVATDHPNTGKSPKLTVMPLDNETKKKVMILLHKAQNKKSDKSKRRQNQTKNTKRRTRKCCQEKLAAEEEKNKLADIWIREYEKIFAKKNVKKSNSSVKKVKTEPMKKTVITPFSFLPREEEFLRKKEIRTSQVKKYETKRWARPAPVFKKKSCKPPPPARNKPATVPIDIKLETVERNRKWEKFIKECKKKHRKLERERKLKEALELKEIRRKATPEIHTVPYEELGITPKKDIMVSPFRKLREECLKIYSPFFHGKKKFPDPPIIDNTGEEKENLEDHSVPPEPQPLAIPLPPPEPIKKTSSKGDKKPRKPSKSCDKQENIKTSKKTGPTNVDKRKDVNSLKSSKPANIQKSSSKISRFSYPANNMESRNSTSSMFMKIEPLRITNIKTDRCNGLPQKKVTSSTSPVQVKKQVRQPLSPTRKAKV